MSIILLGYMGCGKSTISKNLSQALNLRSIDLDDYISERENKNIPDIFKDKGEIYFRTKENFYLKELLENKENIILALGGGTPCYANNIEIINNKSVSFFLNGSLQMLYDRLVYEKAQRPLISGLSDDKLKEFIAKHLFERKPYYEKANHIINIDSKTPQEITTEIVRLLN